MDKLPNDILEIIERDFTAVADKEKVTAQVASLWTTDLNVGADQLAMCILYIANGNSETVNEIFKTNFHGDPRDLIIYAMEKSGKTINWGIGKMRRNNQ